MKKLFGGILLIGLAAAMIGKKNPDKPNDVPSTAAQDERASTTLANPDHPAAKEPAKPPVDPFAQLTCATDGHYEADGVTMSNAFGGSFYIKARGNAKQISRSKDRLTCTVPGYLAGSGKHVTVNVVFERNSNTWKGWETFVTSSL